MTGTLRYICRSVLAVRAGIDLFGLLEGIEGTFRYTYLGTID